jgi:triphosphoribosyl-dephospho-CoA synthase
MSPLRTTAEVRRAFLAACRAELEALKPGNVHVHAAGHGMQVWHFERSAEASARHIADPALGVGARVLAAMRASFAIAGCNTNLGILLLAAPLARSADTPLPGPHLRDRLSAVLAELDLADARDAFRAIALANPAGLGHVDTEDVSRPPSMSLRAAMQLAAGRDRISRAYVTDYADVFDVALPALAAARCRAAAPDLAVSTLHMTLLSAFPDSHIARKHGAEVADAVQHEARALATAWTPVARPDSVATLLAFDRDLKRRGINPGTTADFVVATLFAEALDAGLSPPHAS